MREEELRALVRAAVERHLGVTGTPPLAARLAPVPAAHPGFHRYTLPGGAEGDGPCLVEPSVRCHHCGFCQSHGY